MKKNSIIKMCGFSLGCIASFTASFALEKDHIDRFITKGVIAYYEEGTHTIDMTYDNDKEYNYYEGYIIDNIVTFDNSYKVTYRNNEDVVDIVDGSDFGLPISDLNKDYVKAAKRLYLKSH